MTTRGDMHADPHGVPRMWFRVSGTEFWVFGFRVGEEMTSGPAFDISNAAPDDMREHHRVSGFGYWASGIGFGYRFLGIGYRVSGTSFREPGLRAGGLAPRLGSSARQTQ